MAYFYIINFNLSFPQHPLYWSEAGIMGCNPLPRHETQANYNYQAELGKFTVLWLEGNFVIVLYERYVVSGLS